MRSDGQPGRAVVCLVRVTSPGPDETGLRTCLCTVTERVHQDEALIHGVRQGDRVYYISACRMGMGCVFLVSETFSVVSEGTNLSLGEMSSRIELSPTW